MRKFNDGEIVATKDTGEILTISSSAYSHKMKRRTYKVEENSNFFFYEDDLERFSGKAAIESTEIA